MKFNSSFVRIILIFLILNFLCLSNGFSLKNKNEIGKFESIPEGWKLGAIQNKLKGLGWITNGTENARLSKEEIPPDGWKFGKTQRKNKNVDFL